MPISEVTAYKYRAYLRIVRVMRLQKPFVEATRQDLLHGWRSIDTLKVTVGPEDILSDEELFKVYQACHSLRDKALSTTAYEGAFRPHELLRQRKSDVMFDEYGAVIYVRPATAESNAKTGARKVRVINASPLLANWIENHPLRDRDAPLWVDQSSNTTFEQLKATGWRKIVKRWAKEARLEKRVTPYLFRHTRLTHLAKYMTEAQLCVFSGWKIGSDMPRM
jgi:integrase/recombinase XerD